MTPLEDVGFCLDVDGTVHRSGSVFVETLAALRAGDALPLDARERNDLGVALDAVAAYRGGARSQRRWRLAFGATDLLRRAFGGDAARSAIAAVIAASASDHSTAAHDAAAYNEMQARTLDAYGRVLRGRDADAVERALRTTIPTIPVDSAVRRTLREFVADGAAVHLVSDAPEHVVEAYAAGLTGRTGWTTGTRFERVDGTYTGDYTLPAKGDVVERRRERGDWDFTVAAGDSESDRAMRDAADVFLAVGGQGSLAARVDADATLPASEAVLADVLNRSRPVVAVPSDVGLDTALRAVLEASGYAG
ncbi:haloacid dehalogenase-like hydrolase [Halarchaeum sp. P4]|uniref:haloacid dehalogenase-like hydrolase n=1 Tax=Halarchaeum sp. P4 TaxID=3421639 RepID=UPI003EBBC979